MAGVFSYEYACLLTSIALGTGERFDMKRTLTAPQSFIISKKNFIQLYS
jgi:hypothetical protein